MLIKNATIYTETEVIKGSLAIKNGKIEQIFDGIPDDLTLYQDIIDGSNLNVIPGFIDTHIHGANGADVMDATTEAISTIANYLVSEGTTSFLATTITQSTENIERALTNLAQYENEASGAEMIGIHLEGPFIEKSKAGAQPLEYIKKPDLDLFNHWQEISGHKIKTITLAPEHDQGWHFTSALRKAGVNVSAGHTNANFSELDKAVKHGVNQMTHLCDAMSGIHHRDIGAVGLAFLSDELKAEIIADGIHVDPTMLQLIYRNIGPKRLIIITDAMRAKGLEPGDYELGGQPVRVTEDRAVLDNGSLAGSILNMIDGAKQFFTLPNVSIQDIIQMTSVNPAKQAGVFKDKGSIAVGKDADLLLVDHDLNLKMTLKKGKIVYEE
ncbi:N-acetylglucosamine-6-phosphate deacetylase [Amphibacillus sp. MSJ-3]|uniref:N-acetylglucosamine-6-phosphate deacetylase n=1 Tax=Amphibacillus sp. MSJ-3 TaxID=2841505 RepID=UPI001C0F1B16|nr:N-acetylglucosamine-6-phosphate deacetylase [Amphibacillus sp. MSJ-3]MBU5595448.1 N-acetylglucosamine-6-phosphate deacetylase [Amphibacillus sp. MSJ-3]